MSSYREAARFERKRAKAELASGDNSRLDFAGLAIRKALEYLTYDRLQAYGKEINLDLYEDWQPRKVIARLSAIDPLVGQPHQLYFAVQDDKDTPARPDQFKLLGSDVPLSVKVLRKHYDALGSYLHVQTIKQLRERGSVNYERLRERCVESLSEIDKVLESTVWNNTLGSFTDFECIRCGRESKLRHQDTEDKFDAWCVHCDAPYSSIKNDGGEYDLTAKMTSLPCSTDDCDNVHLLWDDKVKVGDDWSCEKCGGMFRYIICVQPIA